MRWRHRSTIKPFATTFILRIDTFETFKLYDFMAQAKADGLIRHIGFSFHGNPETLRYLLDHYDLATVLSGMSNPEQVEDNIRTFTNFKPIAPDEEEILGEIAAELQKIKAVPCTRCAIVCPVPKG